MAEPHRMFTEAGWEITIATPGDVTPTLDPVSMKLPLRKTGRMRR